MQKNTIEIIRKFYGFTPSEAEANAIISAAHEDYMTRHCNTCGSEQRFVVLDDVCSKCFVS